MTRRAVRAAATGRGGRPASGAPAAARRHARLSLEKYPVASNYPAEHLFTTNTYML